MIEGWTVFTSVHIHDCQIDKILRYLTIKTKYNRNFPEFLIWLILQPTICLIPINSQFYYCHFISKIEKENICQFKCLTFKAKYVIIKD